MAVDNRERWRCLAVGCNPVLDADSAKTHSKDAGHRTARWPVRSAEGKRRARQRNRSGYYDRYNVGEKSAEVRLGAPGGGSGRGSGSGLHEPLRARDGYRYEEHPFSSEALGQD